MSTQLFVVPVVQTTDQLGNTINVPEYFDTDLSGSTFACMPLTGASLVLLATAENDALAAESDVFAFPADLTPTMSDADIAALTAVLQNANVPTDFLVSPITYAQAAQTIAQIAQVLQQNDGAGTPITLGSTSQGVGKIGGLGGSSQNAQLLLDAAAYSGSLILNDVNLGGF